MKRTIKTKPSDQNLWYFDAAIEAWRLPTYNRDTKLSKTFTADRRAMKKVRGIYAKGDMVKAYEAASRLDTILRDHLPECVWNDLIIKSSAAFRITSAALSPYDRILQSVAEARFNE